MSNTTRPRKAVATRVPDLSAPVDFDLDAVANESTARPFRFSLAGQVFTMLSPDDVDWQTSFASANGAIEPNREALRQMLGDDYERFSAIKLPAHKLWRLIEECVRFYGVSPGES